MDTPIQTQPKPKRGFGPNYWCPQYTKAVALHCKGLTDEQVSHKIGMTIGSFSRLKGKELFRARVESYNNRILQTSQEEDSLDVVKYIREAREILLKNTKGAAKYVVRCYKKGDARKDKFRMEAAIQILDRCNVKGKEFIETSEKVLSPEELASTKNTLAELEQIVTRFSNNPSRFILSEKKTELLASVTESTVSSVTDQGSDVPIPILP